MTSIYEAPDIRKQKFEEVEAFITQKRVRRMVIAQSYRETQLEKAEKLRDKELVKYHRACERIDRDMEKVSELLDKLSNSVEKLSELHSDLFNIEKNIEDAK